MKNRLHGRSSKRGNASGGQKLPPAEEGPFSAKHVRFGNYDIVEDVAGQGPTVREQVKGKAAAAARVAELNTNAVKVAPATGSDAPAD